jgi:S1-C subfamily serine protease
LIALEQAMTDVIDRAAPSVVAITRVKSEVDGPTRAVRGRQAAAVQPGIGIDGPLGLIADQIKPSDLVQPGEFGSGVVVGSNGEILTAFHLVQGSTQILVRAAEQQQFEAEVIAADPRSDLAVIAPRLGPGQPGPRLRPIALGDASKLRQGSFLVALGNAYNAARDDGRPSASWGILSNTARRIVPPVGEDQQVRQYFRFQPTLMQLDAKLNLGMSGGAVVNMRGELVGITTDAASPAGFDVQAGYAIPIDRLGRRIVETLREGREMEYGFLGIRLDPLVPNGIRDTDAGTPAAEARLIAGDVITAVGDMPVDDRTPLPLAMALVPVGRSVRIQYLRDGKTGETSVLVSKYPLQGEVIATTRPPSWRGIRVDFASVLGGGLDLKALSKGGVGVIEVEANSKAEAAGLKKGMVITSVGGKKVRTPEEFLSHVSGLKGPVELITELGPEESAKVTIPE